MSFQGMYTHNGLIIWPLVAYQLHTIIVPYVVSFYIP